MAEPPRSPRSGRPRRIRLLELDLAVELHVDLEPRHLERHMRGKRFAAADRAVLRGLQNRALDLALGVDADHFQELANAQIEGFFIHDRSFSVEPWNVIVVPPGEYSALARLNPPAWIGGWRPTMAKNDKDDRNKER